MSPEQDEFRRRAVRAALVVAGIAAAIGLVIGGLTATAVYVTDVLPDPAPAPTVPEEETDDAIPSPSLSPTATPSPAPSATPTQTPTQTAVAGSSPSPTTSSTPSPSPTKTSRSAKPKPDRQIHLRAGSSSAGTFEQVTLSGRYPGGNGTALQVQRREGGSWVDFPTSPTVTAGTFSTYIASGQTGPNQFRVVDPSTGRTSNVVVVNIS